MTGRTNVIQGADRSTALALFRHCPKGNYIFAQFIADGLRAPENNLSGQMYEFAGECHRRGILPGRTLTFAYDHQLFLPVATTDSDEYPLTNDNVEDFIRGGRAQRLVVKGESSQAFSGFRQDFLPALLRQHYGLAELTAGLKTDADHASVEEHKISEGMVYQSKLDRPGTLELLADTKPYLHI